MHQSMGPAGQVDDRGCSAADETRMAASNDRVISLDIGSPPFIG
jgi:hypothetical protein